MSVKKLSKELRKQKNILTCAFILGIFLVICIALFVYLYTQNYITYICQDEVEASEKVESSTAMQADAIILNNVLLGGVKDNIWISSEKMYEVLRNETDVEIRMYSKDGYLGTFETASFKANNDFYYTKTTKYPEPDSYIAIGTKNIDLVNYELETFETSESDIYNVKKALGKYMFLNNSVRIVEAYKVRVADGNLASIYSVVSSGSSMFGVYSALIYSYANKSYLIKYSYVKGDEYSASWPVYSIKNIIDLNADGKLEIIVQETNSNSITYSVYEYVSPLGFREVLRENISLEL